VPSRERGSGDGKQQSFYCVQAHPNRQRSNNNGIEKKKKKRGNSKRRVGRETDNTRIPPKHENQRKYTNENEERMHKIKQKKDAIYLVGLFFFLVLSLGLACFSATRYSRLTLLGVCVCYANTHTTFFSVSFSPPSSLSKIN
jgi:hypothetical protein